MEFPGQGPDPNLIRNLAATAAVLNPLTLSAGPGIKPASWHCRDTSHPNPVVPQWGTPIYIYIYIIVLVSGVPHSDSVPY